MLVAKRNMMIGKDRDAMWKELLIGIIERRWDGELVVPAVEYVQAQYVFGNWNHMYAGSQIIPTSISLPDARRIGPNVFSLMWGYRKNQTQIIDCPNVTILDDSAFRGCRAAAIINVGRLVSVGATAFLECTAVVNTKNTMDEIMALPNCISPNAINVKYVCTDGQVIYVSGSWVKVPNNEANSTPNGGGINV